MNNPTDDIRQELFEKQIEYGFLKVINCSHQENLQYAKNKKNGESLPENVRQYKDTQTDQYVDEFYYLNDTKLSDAEKQEYLKYIELDRLDTIKKCLIFFTVLTVIFLIIGLIAIAL